MSGFFGIFNRYGKQVEEKVADDMLKSMSSWNPDECNLWMDGSVALGHTMLWNTPESIYEHLPLQKDIYVLTMDARIDNRNELVKELELPDYPISEIGDSEFILAAYSKWGEECPKYLLGDFAFAIWDEKKQQLFCARDHIGIKLFHFYLSDDLFIFGNDIEGLLKHEDVPKILDDKTVATFLKGEGIHTKRDTFFEKIKKLPPATTLTITKSNVVKKKYWYIEDSPSIHYDTYDEYVQKLKELFDNAIDARLRTVFPVASHLSGGIDSSSIAVSAGRKLKNKHQKLYAFNWMDIPENNEEYEYEAWKFSRRIAEGESNIVHEEFCIDPHFMIKQYEEHNFLTKGTMFYWREYAVQDMVEAIEARTLLSGWGGDEMISYSGATSYLFYLSSQKKIIEIVKYLYYEKKYSKYSWINLFKRLLRMILPPYIVEYLKRKRKRKRKRKINDDQLGQDFYNRYTTKEFKKYMNSHQSKEFPSVSGVREMQLVMYNYGHLQNRIESWALSAFSKRIEYRYPLLDKKIVEYAMGIPEEIFYPKKGITRHLMKNMVSTLLPYDIVWFIKADEPKVNKKLKKDFTKALEIMQKNYKDKDYKIENKFLENYKIKMALDTFDFEKSDSFKLGNIVLSIMLLNSIRKL